MAEGQTTTNSDADSQNGAIDRVTVDFEGSDAAVKRGFLLARDVLRPYVR